MKKLIAATILIGAIFLFSKTANAQKGLKIGVVDIETIVKTMPEAATADKKLQDLSKKYRDSLVSLEKKFNSKMEKYNKQKAMMTPKQQKKEEQSLQQIQMDYQKFQQEKLGAQGELAQTREKLLSPIRKKVKIAIEKIAKKEKMSFVLDKSTPILLYAEDKYDITFSVLDLIKRGNK